jgi:membrane protease subunit HflC
MMRSGILIAAGIGLFVAANSAFVVREGEQALITQFGKIVGDPITTAGLYWKTPLVQDVRYFEKRILTWDGDPNQIPTKDKKYIVIDTTARWRIKDVIKFAQAVQTEDGARPRLDGILDGVTRDIISRNNLVEAVRNTNSILDRIKAGEQKLKEAGDSVEALEIEEQITGEIEPISSGREKLSEEIIERARPELDSLGIELIDVQLRRIAYEASVESKVFSRMISERQRIAEKIRSIGKGEDAKIRGKLDRDLKEIESGAYRKSEEIRGKADAEAIAIYASAIQQQPEYYKFVRSLDAYKRALADKADLILTTDNEFLKALRHGK